VDVSAGSDLMTTLLRWMKEHGMPHGSEDELVARLRERIADPERTEYGLPEVGWGRAVFGDAWAGPRDGSG